MTLEKYINAADYSGLSTNGNAQISATLPKKYVGTTDAAINNVYHGSMTVKQGADASYFLITASGLSKDACAKAAQADFGRNFIGVAVGTSEPSSLDGTATGTKVDIGSCADNSSVTYAVK